MRRVPHACSLSILTFVLAWAVPHLVSAQDTNYWNNQYGPRSMLLGGAVIGSAPDMSATYYNPGALGYVEEPGLLVSANAYQITSMTIKDGAGEGIDLNTSNVNLLPNMLAGGFRWSWLGKNKFAYSLLTRHRTNVEIRGGRVTRADVLPDSPGEEDFAGGLLAAGDVKELWAGLSWARGLSEKIGVGITQYLSIHNAKSQFELFAQALTNAGDVSLVYDIDNYSSDVYSLLWKAGLGFNLWPLTVGITVTTPNVQLFGSGGATVNSTRVGVADVGEGTPDGFETDIQNDVAANYRSPLSVGAGAAWRFTNTTIHGSVEWFDKVGGYDVLELESFVSQGTGNVVERTLRHQLDSVVNFGVGLEQKFGEKVSGYLSFNTDQSAFNPASDVAVTGFDIIHVTGGTDLAFGRYDVMLGVSYAWGSETIQQSINLNPGDDQEVIDSEDMVDLVYRRLTFIVGFSVTL